MIDEDFIKAFKESEKFKDFVFEDYRDNQLRCERKDWAIIISHTWIQFIRRNGKGTFFSAENIAIVDGTIELFSNTHMYIGRITLEELA